MIRFYLKLIPIFAVIFLALTLTARALGTTQPPNPALRGFTEGCEDKPQPCWYGIVPGVTNGIEVKNYLVSFNYIQFEEDFPLVDFYDPLNPATKCDLRITYLSEKGAVNVIELHNCPGIQLGDTMQIMGSPVSIFPYEIGNTLFFAPTLQAVLENESLSSFSKITDVFLWPKATVFGQLTVNWAGFIPQSRYCRLQLNLHDINPCNQN